MELTQILGLVSFLVVLFVCIAMGYWVAFSLAAAGLVALALAGNFFSQVLGIGWVIWNTLNSFTLTAIPLFLLMGNLLLRSDISTRFYRGISAWVDFVPGKLLQTNIVSCGIFAAISGSSVATSATLGAIAYPELEKRGYSPSLTCATLAAGGTLGIMIPPSIPFIIFGTMVSESIGKLYLAGVVPGIILIGIFMIYTSIRCTIQPKLAPGVTTPWTWKERFRLLKDVMPLFALVVIVLGGMYSGIFTPTEAAAIGVLATLILVIAFKKFNFGFLKECLMSSLGTTCMIMFIVIGAQVAQFGLAVGGVTRAVTNLIIESGLPPMGIMIGIYLLYLVLGCVVDGLSMMLLTLPLLYPVVQALGFDLRWFGVIVVLMIHVGGITPPVGLNLFVLQGVSKQPLWEIARASIPFVILMLVVTALLTALPNITLWLPTIVMGK